MAAKRRKQMEAAREQLYRNRVQVGFSQADLDSFNTFSGSILKGLDISESKKDENLEQRNKDLEKLLKMEDDDE